MTIAQTNILWEIKIHKIHIKEWASVKDEILGMVSWDSVNQEQPEITWTDYHHDSIGNYESKFVPVVKPYLDLFLQESEYKFRDMSKCWLQKYAKGDYHAPHDHGPRGYACVFYAEMDPTVHGSTEFLQPFPNLDGRKGMESIQVEEGDLVLFPCNLFHMAPPHQSPDKFRTIIAFNLY